MPRSVRGPIVVAVVMAIGLGAGIAGILWMRAARPVPGDYLDALAQPDGVIAVRKQRNGKNAFVERWAEGKLRWRGLVPTYDGAADRLGLRSRDGVVRVRVRRGGRPAEFVFERDHGLKLDVVYFASDAEADAAYPTDPGTPPAGVTYDAAQRSLSTGTARFALPPGALAPRAYHQAGPAIWVVAPDGVTGLSLPGLTQVARLQ